MMITVSPGEVLIRVTLSLFIEEGEGEGYLEAPLRGS